jgi:hypothetical protein
MHLEQLQKHVDARFDKLETKLDSYAATTTQNTTDIAWLKQGGTIALTLVAIPALGWLLVQFLTK